MKQGDYYFWFLVLVLKVFLFSYFLIDDFVDYWSKDLKFLFINLEKKYRSKNEKLPVRWKVILKNLMEITITEIYEIKLFPRITTGQNYFLEPKNLSSWIINLIDVFYGKFTLFFLPFSIPGNPLQFLLFLPSAESHFCYNCKREVISFENRTYHTSARVKQCFWQRNTAPLKDQYFHGWWKTYYGRKKSQFS